MTFWKSICQLKFLSVVLGLLCSSFLALGENENPGKTPAPPANEKNATSAMALQTALNQSLSVQNLSGMSRLLAPSKIQVADLSQEAKDAKNLFDQLQSQGKLLSTLTNSALQTLPFAVPIDNTSQGYLMIKKATFFSDHVELDVYARLLLGDQEIYFGATGVKYVMASGMAGTVGLVMLGTQEFSNTQYKVSLTGGSMKTTPPGNASQLKINCGSFAGLVIKGNLELNKDTFLKLDDKGYPMPDGTAAVVSSPIDYQATALTGLTVPVKNPLAFTLKKSQTVMGFSLSNVSFDFSEKATPSAITSTVGSFLGNNSNMINQWTGLFTTASTVYVPMFFIPATPKDPTPIRPSFQAGVLLLDDSGLYMNASGTGIANFSQLGGSPMTIDQISFTLAKSNYSNFSLSGKMGVLAAKSPFKKNDKSYDFSTLSKDEYLTYAGSLDDKSQSFSLKVNQQDNMYFLGAKSTLRDDSKVDFVEDTPTYRSAKISTDGNGTTTSTGGNELNPFTSADLPGMQTVNANPNGLTTGNHTLQARLVTPKLSFRYVIGLDVDGKEVSHNDKGSNTDKILSLGVFLVEDLQLGYSFLSKKVIFKFTRMGYEQSGNAPVFGKFGLKQAMLTYNEVSKECTANLTFYANVNPFNKQEAFEGFGNALDRSASSTSNSSTSNSSTGNSSTGNSSTGNSSTTPSPTGTSPTTPSPTTPSSTGNSSTGNSSASNSPTTPSSTGTSPTSTTGTYINIVFGVDVNFNWAVNDNLNSLNYEAQFTGIALSTFRIQGDAMGFVIDGSLDYERDEDDPKLFVIQGALTAGFKIPGLKKIVTNGKASTAKSKEDTPQLQVNFLLGRAQEESTKEYFMYAYFDFLLSFGDNGLVIGPDVFLNGFGGGLAINMMQTNNFGSRYSMTGMEYAPRRRTYGGMLAVTFYGGGNSTRGTLGIYVEGAKATKDDNGNVEQGGGFRRLQIFGTVEFARDNTQLQSSTPQQALLDAGATKQNSTQSPANNQSGTPTPANNTSTPAQNEALYRQQIEGAVKMLNVSLDDKFAILKLALTFDASTDDLIIEGSAFGFMHVPLRPEEKDSNGIVIEKGDNNRSYVRGIAAGDDSGFMGMIAFRLQIENAVKEGKENAGKEKKDKKNEPNPVNGYLWIGRPDQPLAIEVNINVGNEKNPTYLHIAASLFIVGGNVPLPTNQVVLTPIVEDAKTQINEELQSRGEQPIEFNLPVTVTHEGTSYFSLGLSLEGSVELTANAKAVGAYFKLALGVALVVTYDKAYNSCNDSHWLGSGVFHGSGALGLEVNIRGSRQRYEIAQFTLTAAGAFDFKGSYGAVMYEYSLLGGIVEGRGFATFGDSPCLSSNLRTYAVNSRVNLVKATVPYTEPIRSETSSEAHSEYSGTVRRHEAIILVTDPQIAMYEACNVELDGGQTLENVFIAINYYAETSGTGLARLPSQQQRFATFFVSNGPEVDIDPRKMYRKMSTLHDANARITLGAILVITDGSQQENSSAWKPIEGSDFQQEYRFTFRTNDNVDPNVAANLKKDNRWYYINPVDLAKAIGAASKR
ncbi:hypothetical protein [Spirosoma aerolatum]|uniref:hypothetical protein n=1 Tax=Spirosoma aerolatum TaxID=1211326 RepID=UPI0009ACDEB4|nr:hypothetical protein [Spirosoma aerolatum]